MLLCLGRTTALMSKVWEKGRMKAGGEGGWEERKEEIEEVRGRGRRKEKGRVDTQVENVQATGSP